MRKLELAAHRFDEAALREEEILTVGTLRKFTTAELKELGVKMGPCKDIEAALGR